MPDIPLATQVAVDAALADIFNSSGWAARHGMSSTVIDMPGRLDTAGTHIIVVNQLVVTYVTPLRNITVQNFNMVTSAALTGTGITAIRMGLFTAAANGDVTLVAESANDTALFATGNTLYTKAFDTARGLPASYAMTRGTRYAVGVAIIATTVTAGSWRAGDLTVGALASLVPVMSAVKSPVTDLATATTLTANSKVPYVRLS